MSLVKEFIMPAAILTGICVVVSAALVATYDLTAPIIDGARIEKENESRSIVLSGASGFSPVSTTASNVSSAYKADNGAGYVLMGQAKGYGGTLNVMVGIDENGLIEKALLMENSETQGLGSKVGLDSYTDQYKGKDSALVGIDAISGATVSSDAFKEAVSNCFTAFDELEG